jgi:hypothetical protein
VYEYVQTYLPLGLDFIVLLEPPTELRTLEPSALSAVCMYMWECECECGDVDVDVYVKCVCGRAGERSILYKHVVYVRTCFSGCLYV